MNNIGLDEGSESEDDYEENIQ